MRERLRQIGFISPLRLVQQEKYEANIAEIWSARDSGEGETKSKQANF